MADNAVMPPKSCAAAEHKRIRHPGTLTVRGALLLSTEGGDIDSVIASERWALLRFFLVLAAVMLMLSLSLANTIAEPVRKLAEAAERVRRGIKSRQQIPDFTNRSDEIGHLSRALGEMTQAMYNRIDSIESFAADVAHELKNPLTSLRSAVETLPRVKSETSRMRLMEIMQHDVRRLDRLISDISDASRLDAEMARSDSAAIDLDSRVVAAMDADLHVRDDIGARGHQHRAVSVKFHSSCGVGQTVRPERLVCPLSRTRQPFRDATRRSGCFCA